MVSLEFVRSRSREMSTPGSVHSGVRPLFLLPSLTQRRRIVGPTMIVVQLRNIVRRRAAGANSIPVNWRAIDPISGCSFLSAACLSFGRRQVLAQAGRNHGLRPWNSELNEPE